MPWRKIATIALVVITSLFVLVSSVAVWGKRTLFDTDRFTAVVASVVSDPAVTNALATRLTDSVFDAVQDSGVIADNMPAAAAAAPAGAAAGRCVGSWASRSRSSWSPTPGQQIMVRAVRRTHAAAMRVLDGEKPGNAVNIENGAVMLNLVPAVNGGARSGAGPRSADRQEPARARRLAEPAAAGRAR